jgi:hypothetical protein
MLKGLRMVVTPVKTGVQDPLNFLNSGFRPPGVVPYGTEAGMTKMWFR